MWDGVMAVPEAKAVNECMTTHTECITYTSIRKEAQATLDPSDPAYFMYDKHTADNKTEETQEKVTHDKERKEENRERKKERFIVIPEFVENLDTGDGSMQFEEEYGDN